KPNCDCCGHAILHVPRLFSISSIGQSGRVAQILPDRMGRMSVTFMTYAVGVLSLRQSGSFSFRRVRLFRATRGKTAHKRMAKYHAAAGEIGIESAKKALAGAF